MSDLKSEKWLWAKGVMFAIIGCLALGLLLAEIATPKHKLLIILAIWGFCRVYYFAFYVIEKYADPSFRFAGLLYVPQYVYRRWNNLPTTSDAIPQNKELSWMVQWPFVFLILNLFGIDIDNWAGYFVGQLSDYWQCGLTGVLSVSLGLLAILGAFGPLTIGWRLVAVYSLTAVYSYEWFQQRFEFMLSGYVLIVVSIPLAILICVRMLSRRRLTSIHNVSMQDVYGNGHQTVDAQESFSIRFLIGLTIAIAIFVLITKQTWSPGQIMYREWLFGCVGGLFMGMMTLCLLQIILSRDPVSLKLLSGLALLMLAVGFVIIFRIIDPDSQKTAGHARYVSYLLVYLGGYFLCLIPILIHGRVQGIRWIRPTRTNLSNKLELELGRDAESVATLELAEQLTEDKHPSH